MSADDRLVRAIKRGDVRGVREMLSMNNGMWRGEGRMYLVDFSGLGLADSYQSLRSL